MVNLEVEDRKQLITLLKDLPELATERSRQQILELADLKQLASRIDLSGAPFVAVSEIVSYLSNYGRLTHDHEALGLLLNTLKNFIGVQQQAFLDILLTKYDMMTPISALPAIDQWRGEETPIEVLEKIIGENTLRPISFLQQGLQVARAVAYIGVRSSQGCWSGTGFLVAQDLLLTNHHVLPHSNLLSDTIFRFNYEENFQGEAQSTAEYRAKPNGVFHTNQALDYTLVELEGEPGQRWGWLPLLPKVIRKGSRVNIIQHPLGQPKQISLQNNFVQYMGGNVVQYITSTLQGSSGSPVFNDAWEVVALHHAGGNISEPTTQQRYFRNEGILVESSLEEQQDIKLVVPDPSLSGTQAFEFPVVMVDVQGKEISRRRGQAYYLTEDLGNGVKLEMVYIPGGTFLMGSPESKGKRYSNERPQHSVAVKPFLISKYPITQAQWREVASLPQVNQNLNLRPSHPGGKSHPVTQVSWHDAVEFCERLSQKTGHQYRLPTEAEWEYACRAGTTTPFHFGETITSELANYDARQSYRSKHQGIYREATTPVGSFQVANPFGLFDMHGNVWDWCLDHWHENYDNAPTNGDAWLDSSENQTRVLRGGSLLNDPSMCRSSSRFHQNASERFKHVGFRIVFCL